MSKYQFKKVKIVACNFLLGGVQLILLSRKMEEYSVIQHSGSYGHGQGLWELLEKNGDVQGWLTFSEVMDYLDAH